MTISNIKIDNKILNDIKKIAIKKNTTQSKLINDYLKRAVEEESLSPECKKLNEELNKIYGEMESGNYIEVDVDNLEKRYKLHD